MPDLKPNFATTKTTINQTSCQSPLEVPAQVQPNPLSVQGVILKILKIYQIDLIRMYLIIFPSPI